MVYYPPIRMVRLAHFHPLKRENSSLPGSTLKAIARRTRNVSRTSLVSSTRSKQTWEFYSPKNRGVASGWIWLPWWAPSSW